MSGAEQCAVTFGIPVDREEFDLQIGASDYLAAASKAGAEGLWESQYERVASAAQTLIETAGLVGARVYRRAGLREIAAASGAFRTVILVAHVRGIMVRPEDFPNGVAPVLRKIGAHPLLRDLVQTGGDANKLADALNEVLEGRSLIAGLPRAVAQAATRSRALGSVLCRDLLDEILENDIKPGNRIELFDGLHTLAEIEEAIATLFTGTLDLALCNSDAISTFLELRRDNRLRILHWPDYVFPGPQIVKIEAALRRMQGNYARTRLQIEEEEHLGERRRISMSLEGILSRHFRPASVLAAEPVKRGLLADLRAQKRFNRRIYILLLGLICALALVLIGGLAADVFFARPDRSKILAGAGVTVSVILAWMHRIVRELAELNLVITVMSHSSEAEIQQWIPRLAPRLLSAPEDDTRQRKRTPRRGTTED